MGKALTVPVFLDTNILIYSLSTEPAEYRKRDIARVLLQRDDCILSVQVLQEFYVQSTRVNRPGKLSHKLAVGLIDTWQRFDILENTVLLMFQALAIRDRYGFSYWDSAIISAAVASKCNALLTEDMSDGQIIDGMTIHNPFAEFASADIF